MMLEDKEQDSKKRQTHIKDNITEALHDEFNGIDYFNQLRSNMAPANPKTS